MDNKSVKSKQKPVDHKICPPGKHNVRTHQEKIPPSKKHPKGSITTRHEHCAKNPPCKKKNVLYFKNIKDVVARKFAGISLPPISRASEKLTEFDDADKYDGLIQGWTGYWNNVLKPKDPLDPNMVKALMATESGFNEKSINDKHPPKKKHAHGLLQVTEETAEILRNRKGELKNHLVDVSLSELYDPSANICCGIRWLFRKKGIESVKFKREATWDETMIGYKGYWKDIKNGKTPRALQKLYNYYRLLSQK